MYEFSVEIYTVLYICPLQLDYFSSNEQLKSRISELQEQMGRMSLSQVQNSPHTYKHTVCNLLPLVE